MKYLKIALSHIYFFRPHLLLPIWTPALLGYRKTGESEFPLFLILTLTFLGGFIYGINQIFDREADIINVKNLPLATPYLSLKDAWLITLFSLISVLVFASTVNFTFFILMIIGVLMGILYSVPPFRFSDRWFSALLLNGIGHGSLIFIAGYTFSHSLSPLILLLSVPYFFAYMSVYVFTTIPDTKGDSLTGKSTVSTLMGKKKAGILGLILLLFSLISGFLTKEVPVIVVSLITFPIYIFSIIKGDDKWVVNSNKVAVITLTIAASFYFPLYIPLFLSAILISMAYNLMIMKVRYP